MKKMFDTVYHVFLGFCKICFLIMIVATTYVVIGRYAFHSTPSWGEELVLMCMVWMAMVSASLAVRNNIHIRMSIIDLFLPKKVIVVLDFIANLCVLLFAVFMILAGWKEVMLTARSIMPGLNIKSMWLYLSIPVSGVALIFMYLEKLYYFIIKEKRVHTSLIKEKEVV